MNLCAFSAAQEVCSICKMRQAVFKTILLKSYYFLHFLLLQTAIIARTNYNSLIGECALPVQNCFLT